nr:reverse transcriptase domain-containing protein [Tanacetum cinerariifolium]
ELTLRVGKEAITLNLDQTSRYSVNYNDMTANQIDVIDMACKEYSQEVLDFSDVVASGNPTPYYDPIVSTSSLNLTPFGDSDFLLEEVNAFLALEDDATSLEVDHSYYDTEGDILLFEAFLTKNDKSSIDVPPEVELKDLTPHLEYTFFEGDDKLPVIIAKDLSVKEKAALIKDRTYGKVTCIAHKLEGQVPIEGNKEWCFSQFFLEFLKGFNTLIRKEERGIFLMKIGHQPGYLRKVLNESSIEASIAKKATDTLDDSGMR